MRRYRFLCFGWLAVTTALAATFSYAAPSTSDCSTNTVDIFQAARSGNIKRIQECVSNGIAVDSTNERNETPLMIAVSMRHKECVRWLLSQGADPNHQDIMDRSPVSNAAGIAGDSSILELLLDSKGDPNLRAKVRRLDDGFIVGLKPTPIYNAIEAGSIENALLLISKGAEVDPEVDKDYNSPLASAALYYRFDIVHLLLLKGADYRETGPNEGETVAEFLAQVDVKLIIGPHFRDAKAQAKWEQAMRDWYVKVMELLKEKESEVAR